jgi:secreted trypsin-like serine protease
MRTKSMRKSLPIAAHVCALGALLGIAPVAMSRSMPSAHEAVVGGAPAQLGAFASVAEILDIRGNDVGECSGTVVAPTLVLTAGHCAVNMKTGVANKAAGYRVLTGEATEGGQRQVSTVSGVLVDERFARRVDNRDAALLVLSTPTSAPPVALAGGARAGGLPAGLTATIAGWGKTTYAQTRPTGELHWAATVVQRGRWCRRNAPPFYEHSEICTIDPPSFATGACNGDSGGPLLAPDGSGTGFVEIGIVVHGYQRCSTRRPSVFTRVEAIEPWVQTWIDAYQTPPSEPAPTAPAAPAPSPSTQPAPTP